MTQLVVNGGWDWGVPWKGDTPTALEVVTDLVTLSVEAGENHATQ